MWRFSLRSSVHAQAHDLYWLKNGESAKVSHGYISICVSFPHEFRTLAVCRNVGTPSLSTLLIKKLYVNLRGYFTLYLQVMVSLTTF